MPSPLVLDYYLEYGLMVVVPLVDVDVDVDGVAVADVSGLDAGPVFVFAAVGAVRST